MDDTVPFVEPTVRVVYMAGASYKPESEYSERDYRAQHEAVMWWIKGLGIEELPIVADTLAFVIGHRVSFEIYIPYGSKQGGAPTKWLDPVTGRYLVASVSLTMTRDPVEYGVIPMPNRSVPLQRGSSAS